MPSVNINHIVIPEISDEELRRRADRIKPLVRHNSALCYIKEPHLRRTAFMWNPQITNQAPELREVAHLTTYHTCGHPVFFKPTIAEVLAQIPEELVDMVEAFWVSHAANFNRVDYHVGKTTLYAR